MPLQSFIDDIILYKKGVIASRPLDIIIIKRKNYLLQGLVHCGFLFITDKTKPCQNVPSLAAAMR